MPSKLVIGTRGSKLALLQSGLVKEALKKIKPGLQIDLKIIQTKGDLITDRPLEKIGDKGLFTKELEIALLKGEIDLAVHSMKDMPTELPPGLSLSTVLPREKPWDVFIALNHQGSLAGTPPGFKIGSSSLRRQAQLKRHFPHLNICPVRGNLNTRLKKLKAGQFDGLILAYAGVARMGWLDQVTEIISPTLCLPAVGQGALAVEFKSSERQIGELVKLIKCPVTAAAVEAERAFLHMLAGGCQAPVGAVGEVIDDLLSLKAMVASTDGTVLLRAEVCGDPAKAKELGAHLAENLLRQGAAKILAQNRIGDVE